MVAYSFQSEFAEDVEAGRKCSTIRPHGKRRHARAGEELQLYTGMRTPDCRLLMRVPCLWSKPIEIHRAFVCVDGVRRDVPEYYDELARIEGFSSYGNLQAWFDHRYGLPVRGFVQIRWDPKEALSAPESAVEGVS